MSTPEDSREAKLPVWAQDLIKQLRRDAIEAQKQYSDLFDSQEVTHTAYGDVYNNPRYLPDDRRGLIAIKLDDEGGLLDKDWVQVRREIDSASGLPCVEVMGNSGLAVIPQASNVVRIYPFRNGTTRLTWPPKKDGAK
jgi:hypothetical protein